ncbi:MAG: hypothetical protein FWG45_05925 [Oscillospiraceae bacterium]|nr:hypothetical protein [Oscillospiraceae bacterium]
MKTTIRRIACLAIVAVLAVSLVACSNNANTEQPKGDIPESIVNPPPVPTAVVPSLNTPNGETGSRCNAPMMDAMVLERIESGESLSHYWLHWAVRRGLTEDEAFMCEGPPCPLRDKLTDTELDFLVYQAETVISYGVAPDWLTGEMAENSSMLRSFFEFTPTYVADI